MKENHQQEIGAIFNKHGEHIFRMGLTHMIAVGSDHFDDKNVEAAKKSCIKQEQEIEASGGIPIMTASFQIKIILCAQELSKIPTWEVLKFVKKKLFIG